MKARLRIGVTGGIGSGKSQVCDYFSYKGYPVFSCDAINRELLNDPKYIKKLAKIFPECIENNKVNRRLLATIIFQFEEKRKMLEQISHPAILKNLFSKMDSCEYVSVAEVPLLLEKNLVAEFDKIIVVVRDEKQRIDSVIGRDGILGAEIKKKITTQFPYDKALKDGYFDGEKFYLIFNNSSIESLHRQIDKFISSAIL